MRSFTLNADVVIGMLDRSETCESQISWQKAETIQKKRVKITFGICDSDNK